ncbi:MAG TPA: nucleotidyltransferase domain-containing protein [bacterium (Candidatus Stahlbacteria)]|nr:nucleotidyltransferase domain-containing protein [Candidatus Stahlbacteria bacterium]
MALRKDKVVSEIRDLIKIIEKNGISISAAYLFGSYAKGKASEWSDIDVALISDDFSGVRFYDVEKLLSILKRYNIFIELHPFRKVDFDPENNLFIREITEHTIRIK